MVDFSLKIIKKLGLPIYKETIIPSIASSHIDKLIEPIDKEYIVLYGFDENGDYVGISKDWYIETIYNRIKSKLSAYSVELFYSPLPDTKGKRFLYALKIKELL